jgi:CRP-like cAMP-binding protein
LNEVRHGAEGGGAIDIAAVLGESPTLAGLPQPALDMLARVMSSRTYGPGDALMQQGDEGDCMVVVADGLAQVSVTGDDGVCRVLAQLGPGTVLGEMALLTQEPRSADVLAVAPLQALVLEAGDFEDLCETYPDIAVVLTHLVAERLGQVHTDALGDKVLGGYRIKRRLGLGATAVVYRGEDVDTDECVALKMLSHRLAFDAVAIRRFHRELDIIQRLRHENVARVFGSFEAFATHFMAMEFCDGLNLAELLERHGALPGDQVRALLGQIGRALDHVHEHDVVHKDLKPANVMVNRDGTVKLMDFGIARPPLDMTQDCDVERFFAGTPRYMAPEQFRMIEAGPTVDIYALGCIGYEMLAGEAPFLLDSLGELVQAKTAGDLAPIAELRPDVDSALTEFIERAMSVKPDDRPQDLSAIHAWATRCDPALVAE